MLEVLYLMFNEGYSTHEGHDLVRTDLCHEAVRLVELLASHPVTGLPKVHALAALLCFQAARLPTRVDRSPVVALNRTIALAQVEGAATGLQALAGLEREPALRQYYPLFATRAEFLRQLGRHAEAAACHRQALELTPSTPVRRFLEQRIDERPAGPG